MKFYTIFKLILPTCVLVSFFASANSSECLEFYRQPYPKFQLLNTSEHGSQKINEFFDVLLNSLEKEPFDANAYEPYQLSLSPGKFKQERSQGLVPATANLLVHSLSLGAYVKAKQANRFDPRRVILRVSFSKQDKTFDDLYGSYPFINEIDLTQGRVRVSENDPNEYSISYKTTAYKGRGVKLRQKFWSDIPQVIFHVRNKRIISIEVTLSSGGPVGTSWFSLDLSKNE